VIRSHCLLEEGSDQPAAEQALLDILELDPQNAGARRNLGKVWRRQKATPSPDVISLGATHWLNGLYEAEPRALRCEIN
jgi:hypothetical protein